jgi:hypothetical protein
MRLYLKHAGVILQLLAMATLVWLANVEREQLGWVAGGLVSLTGLVLLAWVFYLDREQIENPEHAADWASITMIIVTVACVPLLIVTNKLGVFWLGVVMVLLGWTVGALFVRMGFLTYHWSRKTARGAVPAQNARRRQKVQIVLVAVMGLALVAWFVCFAWDEWDGGLAYAGAVAFVASWLLYGVWHSVPTRYIRQASAEWFEGTVTTGIISGFMLGIAAGSYTRNWVVALVVSLVAAATFYLSVLRQAAIARGQ